MIIDDKKQNSTVIKNNSEPLILSEIKFNILLKQAMKTGVLTINGQTIKRKNKIVNFKTFKRK